jgi:hypothetical protein
MRFGPDQCQGCAKYIKTGETWVPYGDTMVKYTDDYECADGWVPGNCPDDAFEPDEGSGHVPTSILLRGNRGYDDDRW